MSFQKGNFVKLVATTTIHLGKIEKNLSKDDVVEFDGFEVKVFGQTVSMPELKAGVKRGWLKIFEGASSLPKEEVVVEKPKMEVQKVYDEERPVSEIKKQPEQPEKKKFQIVVEQQDEDIIPIGKIENKSGATIASDVPSDVQGEAVAIKLKTASKVKTVISDGNQASSEINKLDNISANVTAREEFPVVKEVEDSVEVSSTIKTASEEVVVSEELEASEDSVSDEELDQLLESLDEPDEQAIEDAQLLQAIDGDVSPTQGAVTIGKDESKSISLPVGVDWDMSPHWSKRAKIAVERYADHTEILDAIKEVESQGVVKAIEKAMAER